MRWSRCTHVLCTNHVHHVGHIVPCCLCVPDVKFGCEHRKAIDSGTVYSWFYSRYSLQELPRLLSSMAPLFNLRGCTYKVQKSKEAAARVVVWRMGVVRSYTMEASYCGANLGKYKVGWEGRRGGWGVG